MTNTTQPTDTATTSRGTASRRAGRALTIAAATAGALLLWVVNDPWAGIDLVVRQGGTVQPIGPATVAIAALAAGLAAWAVLGLLERFTRRAALAYRIIASVVLLLSFAGPLGSGVGLGSKLALLAMHVTVGAALIIGLPGRRRC